MMKLLSALILTVAVPAVAAEPPPVAPTTPVGSAMTAAPAAPAASTAPTLTPAQIRANEIVCKSTLETGSLVKKHKQCLTRKQWVYVNDQHESFARKMVEDNSQKFAIPN